MTAFTVYGRHDQYRELFARANFLLTEPYDASIKVCREKGVTVYEASALDPKAKIAEDRAKEIDRICFVLAKTADPGLDPETMVTSANEHMALTCDGRYRIPGTIVAMPYWQTFTDLATAIYVDRNANK